MRDDDYLSVFKAMGEVFVMNGLECKISCSTSKVSIRKSVFTFAWFDSEFIYSIRSLKIGSMVFSVRQAVA